MVGWIEVDSECGYKAYSASLYQEHHIVFGGVTYV